MSVNIQNPNKRLCRINLTILIRTIARMERQKNVRNLQNHDLQKQTLKLWPLFSILDKNFLLQIEMVMWYGDKDELNWETALIVTENKDVYVSRTETSITSGVVSILPPQKVEALCQQNIKTMIHTNECSFVLTEAGKVYSWGRNLDNMGEHGIINAQTILPIEVFGLADKRVVDIKCGYFHVLVLTDNGKMYSWGRNYYGQVNHTDAGMIPTPTEVIIEDEFGKKNIQSISCGFAFNMAITCDGELYSWGQNAHGQLGLEIDNEIRQKPIKIKIDAAIAKVECGSQHTLALTREGSLYVWGKNEYGQLGIGSCWSYISYPMLINTKKIGEVIDIATRYNRMRSVAVNKDKRIFIWGFYLHRKSKYYLRPTDINFNTIHNALIDLKNFRKIHNPCRNKKKTQTTLTYHV